jgi:hypothetical protein
MCFKLLGRVSCVMLLAACTTTSKVQDIETKSFKEKGNATSGKIGINDNDQVVIRENSSAQDELAVLDLANTHLRDDVERDLHELKNCEAQLNDPRLGGNGQATASHDIEELRNDPETKQQMGMDEDGELRVVKEQSFDERLKSEKKYQATLKRMKKLAVEHRDSCQRRLSLAREKYGLPGQPYKATGYYTKDGTWVETQRGETSLDDAFEIRAKSKAKGKSSEE